MKIESLYTSILLKSNSTIQQQVLLLKYLLSEKISSKLLSKRNKRVKRSKKKKIYIYMEDIQESIRDCEKAQKIFEPTPQFILPFKNFTHKFYILLIVKQSCFAISVYYLQLLHSILIHRKKYFDIHNLIKMTLR